MAHEAEEAAAAGIARVVMLLSLAAFASAVALRLCDPLLPELARSFDTTTARAAMVITATSIAYGICQLLFGPLGDRFGKFPVIAWACLASTLGALACAAAPTLDSLSLARAMTGATTAALIPLSMAWIGDVVAFDERQHTLAKFMSGQIIGMVSGQAVGGLFADTIGWRWAFVFLAAIYCVVGLLLLRALKRLQQRGTLADPGAADQAGTLARITMILGSAKARGILMTVFIEAMAAFGVMAFIPAYLHERFGISLFHAGSVVAVFGAGGLLYTSFARRWVRALGEARLALVGGALLGIAYLMLSLGDTWFWAVAACLLAGLGFYQLHNTLQTQATQMAPAARGTAVSLFASCFFLAQAVGVSLGAWVIERYGAPWLFASSALILPLLGWRFSRRLARL
ncbi:MAG: MFS transporter [Proteobacteria bacterium]|nr:MFS transporter [Pseudomonadota bacterium]